MAVDHNNPQSRDEEILIATIDRTEYNKNPQSRMEELLLELKEAIEGGGGGEGGLIQKIFLNGVEQEIVNKAVYLTVITNTVNDLVNYYLKTDTYSKLEVNNLIAAISTLHLQKVETLPTEDISQTTIYLVPKTTLLTNNVYDEYINTDGTSEGWELIGDTQIDLSDYVTFTDLEALLNDYVLATDLTTILADYALAVDLTTVANAVTAITDGTEIDSFGDVETALTSKQNATDNSLETEAKTIVGAINEHEGDISTLKSGLTNLDNEVNGDATTYPYADVITIPDAVPANVADCSVKIEPVQDLHGYDHPWVGGAGKNKCEGYLQATIDSSGTIVSDSAYVTHYGKIESGKTYTISNIYDQSGKLVYGIFANEPQIGDTASGGRVVSDSFTFTAASDGYIAFRSNYDHTDGMLEEGTTATTYEPYSNICPISGHTEAVITDTKPNMYVEGTAQIKVAASWITDNTVTAQTATDLTVTGNVVTGTPSSYRWLHIPFKFVNGKTVYLKLSDASITGNKLRISSSLGGVAGYFSNGSYTPTEDFDGFVDIGINPVSTNLKFGIGITSNFNTDDYNKKSPYYTIALGDTIYGGTVDFDSGVMTVDRGIADFSNTTWTYQSQYNRFRADFTGAKQPSESSIAVNAICSNYKVVSMVYTQSVNSTIAVGSTGIDYIYVHDERYDDSTLADFTTMMAGVQFVYELATPFTVQLTPQQIQLLKGQNTLTASTGDISVTVNGVSGAIGSLQSEVNELAGDVETITSVKSATAGTNVTIDGGGYITVGNMVIVNIEFTADDNIASNTVLLNLPNELLTNTPINIYNKSTYDMLSKGRIYNGKLMASEQIVSSNSYYAAGVYIKS